MPTAGDNDELKKCPTSFCGAVGCRGAGDEKMTIKAWGANLDSRGRTGKGICKRQNISVNVGGKVFRIPRHCAVKYPHTRIGSLAVCGERAKLLELCDDYSAAKNEFFFDRDPAFFHHVCHFYTSGVLWVIQEMCPINFEEEIEYWGLSLKDSQLCCWMVFEEKADELKAGLKIEKELQAGIEAKYDPELFRRMAFGDIREKLWLAAENPSSSAWAKAFSALSGMLVLLSIVAMTLNTVEELQNFNGNAVAEWVETVTVAFFTSEYLLRLASAPRFKMFLTSGLGFVDALAVVPYYVQMVFEREDGAAKLNPVLKAVKLLWIFRIFKLARHSTGMRAFGFTLRQCYQQACCILLFIALGIFTFSALLHSAERETEGSPISSIPSACWWAAVSISTVGYGDVVPVTVLGRCVAFGCISFGIILNGMPISFFNKFSEYYAKLKAQEDNSVSVRRRLQLKKRLKHRVDTCFRPAGEANDTERSP